MGWRHGRRLAAGVLGLVLALAALTTGTERVDAAAVSLYDSLVDGPWKSTQGSNWLAQSFTTPSSPVGVTSVTVKIRNASEANSSSVASSYSVSLWSSSSGAPAAALSTVVASEPIGAWGDSATTFPLTTPYSLQPSTTYFVVVAGSSGGTVGWKCNTNAVTTDVTPTPTFTPMMSTNSGSSWSALAGACAGQHFSMTVASVSQTVPGLSAFADTTITLADSPLALTAPTATTTGTFTYTSSDTAVATVSGNQVTPVGVGSTTITAQFTPTNQTDFTTATITMTLTVDPAPTTTSSTSTTSTSTTSTSTPTTTTPAATTSTAPATTTAPASSVPSATTTSLEATTSTSAPTTTTAPAGESTTTVPTATTTSPVPDDTTPVGPSPVAEADNPFSGREAENIVVHIEASTGDMAAGTTVRVEALGLDAGSPVVVTVYSEPTELLRAKAGADGTFRATLSLPASLEPGRHTLVSETQVAGSAVHVAGGFVLDDEGRFGTIVQPSALHDFAGADDARIVRALEYGKRVYDPRTRPLTTAAIVIAATSLLASIGSTRLGGTTGGGAAPVGRGGPAPTTAETAPSEKKGKSKAKLAQVVTKKLKGIQIESSARGDLSATWGVIGTATIDRLSRDVPRPLGTWSKMAPRIVVDGAWLRAMFGSAGLVTWAVGAVLGACAAFIGTDSPLTPSFGFILALMLLGILDAAAGAVGWLVVVAIGLLTGDAIGWHEFLTLLGLGLLFSSVSLLAHVIRPLRRYVAGNSFERWERILDYVIMPVFVAFAAGSMLKALNGLSGLELISAGQVSTTRWFVGFGILGRLAVEDLAAHLYPQRMTMVQPGKLTSPGRAVTSVAIATSAILLLLLLQPFFGLNAITIGAVLLTALPKVLKMWEDDFPDSTALNKWTPRGHLQFFVLLVLGAYLAATLIGPGASPERMRAALIPMLLPSTAFAVIEVFGRSGGTWPNVALKRGLGVVTWTIAVGIVTGTLILFR